MNEYRNKITERTAHYPQLPEGWCQCALQDVFNITMGQSPNGKSINFLSGIEFHQGKLCFTDKYLKKADIYTSEVTKLAEPHSLLLCVRAPVGFVNITDRKICIGRGLASLSPTKGMDLVFGYYLLKSLRERFEEKSTGSTFKAISNRIIKNEIISIPPLAEQKRITHKIEVLFHILDSIAEKL